MTGWGSVNYPKMLAAFMATNKFPTMSPVFSTSYPTSAPLAATSIVIHIDMVLAGFSTCPAYNKIVLNVIIYVVVQLIKNLISDGDISIPTPICKVSSLASSLRVHELATSTLVVKVVLSNLPLMYGPGSERTSSALYYAGVVSRIYFQ